MLLIPFKTKGDWQGILLFTIQYLPLIEYEKGVHVLLLSILMLDMKARLSHSNTLSLLVLLLYGAAAFLIALYYDLRVNGSDVFALFFYANCAVFVFHSLVVVKHILSLLSSTNNPDYALFCTTTSTSLASC